MGKLNLYCQAGYTTQRICVQQDSSLKEIIIDLYNIEGISCHVLSFQTGSYVDALTGLQFTIWQMMTLNPLVLLSSPPNC